MKHGDAVYYRTLSARDTRFDGLFFVGVKTTGIYCRPICTARTPFEKNCRFFPNATLAELAGFRPCLRCRPELAPGNAPVDDRQRLAWQIVQRMEENLADGAVDLESVAAQLGRSSRQIRRIVQSELGVAPIEWLQTRRLLLAKQLLTETRLPVTEIAFASGFASLRRFNGAFLARYGMPPTRLRLATDSGDQVSTSETTTLRLAYRPPYDWDGTLAFLTGRLLKGVETVNDGAYCRTVSLGNCSGWIRVSHLPEKHALAVELSHSVMPILPALLARLRALFDLDAQPEFIAAHLQTDPALRESLSKNLGLRVPGAFDGFELAVRAILGQQITVKGATTLSGRLAEVFAEPIETPISGLTHLTPCAQRLSRAKESDIGKLGIVGARARCIIALAKAVVSGKLRLETGGNPEGTIAQLVALPGIGPWTANYMAMRILRWPDAFPKEDVAVLKALGGISPRTAEERSQAWRPWRSYAVLHLWRSGAVISDQ